MPQASSRPSRVAAIVPAYNEGESLAEVLNVLKKTTSIDDIVVVSDGSTDETVSIARAMDVRVIPLHQNYGKGMALAIGVAHTQAPVLVFIDGDILNLSEYLVEQLIEPVIRGRAAMNIGLRNRSAPINFLHALLGPHLSGLRCLEREIFEAVPDAFLGGFRVETALNWYCRRMDRRISTTVLYDLKHLVKERKRGFAVGLKTRLAMFATVFRAWLSLHWRRPGLKPPGAAHRAESKPERMDL